MAARSRAAGRHPDPGRHAAAGSPRVSTATSAIPHRSWASWHPRARVFESAYAQAGWTKVSTPSIMTSLYPTTHGVARIPDRLPAGATTIAEVYRAAGYATLSLSSVAFTGQFTNLHQGFEELHELTSVVRLRRSVHEQDGARVRRSRSRVDRRGTRTSPFFVYLHVFDPHSPYEPRRPYDAMWADQSKREEHIEQRDALRKVIANPFMAARGMATREEMLKAGDRSGRLSRLRQGLVRLLDPRQWTPRSRASFERLRARPASTEKTAVVFLSDHGEEFQEHGRMWHGQSVYGEMMQRAARHSMAGRGRGRTRVDESVQLDRRHADAARHQPAVAPEGPAGAEPRCRCSNRCKARWRSAAVGWKRRPAHHPRSP